MRLLYTVHPSLSVRFPVLRCWFQTPRFALRLQVPIFGYSSCSPDPASEPMDSPSSCFFLFFLTFFVLFFHLPSEQWLWLPSDSEGEDKWAHGPKPDTVGQKEGSRPSPGPIRCRQRPKVSSNQHIASHLEQRAWLFYVRIWGQKIRCELETCINIQGCTSEGDLLFAQKVRESWEKETGPEWLSIHLAETPQREWIRTPQVGWKNKYWCGHSGLLIPFVLFPTV